MRVVCIEVVNPMTAESAHRSGWLRTDQEYDVLEVYAYPGGRVELRLAADDTGTPALFDSSMFMTVDSMLPAGWQAMLEEGGVLRLGPSEWMEPGFWEAYFDGAPPALEAFKRGARSG